MSSAISQGNISVNISNGVAHLSFEHPKSNSMPSKMLNELSATIDRLGEQEDVRVLVLSSGGTKTFCSGASFDELLSIENEVEGKAFFSGFAKVINSLRTFPYFTIGRIQGKAIGGGVGLASSCDYAFATSGAAVRLSELAIGIGAFVIGPAVERKIGVSAFAEMCIDTEWKSAQWAGEKGLYQKVLPDILALDEEISDMTKKLVRHNPEAIRILKATFWEGTTHWPELLEERAAQSGRLVLSEHTKKLLNAFKAKK